MQKYYIKKKYTIQREIVTFISLFGLTVIMRYYFPGYLSSVFILALLPISLLSRRGYFWLAFYILLLDPPGNLFSRFDSEHSLPLIYVPILGSLLFSELVLFVFLMKALIAKKIKLHYINKRYIIIFLCLLIFLMIITIGNFPDAKKVFNLLRKIMGYFYLITFPLIFMNDKKYTKFFYLLSIVTILAFLSQVLRFVINNDLHSMLGGSLNLLNRQNEIIDANVDLVRPIYSIFAVFLSFIMALFYYSNKDSNLMLKKYSSYIIVIAVFSIFLTATRAWIIATIFILLVFLLFINRLSQKIYLTVIPIILILLLFTYLNPVMSRQISLAYTRTDTVISLFAGDETADGTLTRITERAPRVMRIVNNSPIYGYGFSKIYFDHQDGHVGNQNMLLNAGYLGYSIFIIVFMASIISFLKLYKRISNTNVLKKSVLVFPAYLIGTFIIHSSAQWYRYEIGTNAFAIVCLFMIYFMCHQWYIAEEYEINRRKALK